MLLTLFVYRVSPNATTHESPFYLLYGRKPRLPLDTALLLPTSNLTSSVAELRARVVSNLEHAQRIIASNTQLAQQGMKVHYDKSSHPAPYEVGSKVWVYTPKVRKGLSKKLSHNFHGPYRVIEKLSPVHFKLCTLDNRPVFVPVQANRLKPYCDPADRPFQPPSMDSDSHDLADADLPSDSFIPDCLAKSNEPCPSSREVQIVRPEDSHAPEIIVGVKQPIPLKPEGLT